MRSSLSLSLLAAALIFSVSCSPPETRSEERQVRSLEDGRDAFKVELPPDFVISETKGNFADFQLFVVKKGDVPFVGIYTGSHPNIDPEKPSGFYSLLTTRYDWPTQIHVWTYPLGKSDLATAKKIASSIAPQ